MGGRNMSRDDVDRIMFFERARDEAQREVNKDPRNAHALTQLGGALLELSHFQNMPESYQMIEEAAEHFEASLRVDPHKHETMWCLGNAHTSRGFLTADTDGARVCFMQAKDVFQRALAEDSGNDMYRKAVEMCDKAPELHADLHRQIQAQEALQQQQEPLTGGRESVASSSAGISDFWYDAAGWVILGLGIAWISFARAEQTSAPSAN